MTNTAQYARKRRTRRASALEFLTLVGVAGVVGLVVLVVGVTALVDATSVRTVVWWGFVAVLLAGAVFIMAWLGVLEYYDGRPWQELAAEGRAGEAHSVRTRDGVILHAEVEGPADAQVVVVFVHGIQTTAAAWRNQREALVDSGIRRVSYDARGHGRSGVKKLDQSIRGVRQLAADLGAVIDETAPTGRLVIVGHSMGGLTASALATVRPDLADRIGGYVLCSTSAGPLAKTMNFGLWKVLTPAALVMRREVAGLLVVMDALPRFVPRLIGMLPYLVGLRFIAVHGRTARKTLRPTAAIVYANGFRQAGDMVIAILDHDECAEIANLAQAHVAIIKGDNDRLVPPTDQQYLADHIPGAELTAIPKCGHMPGLEEPDVVNAEIRRIVELVAAEADAGEPAEVEDEAEPVAEPGSWSDLASSGVDTVSNALGGIVETVERFAPAGPIREGVHSVHRKFRIEHSHEESNSP
ncbi:alpha/beta fold hydrolase [Antrihabitans sp. YC2-6]|uniref:alpha/beta fold hydrolase n=1 Tax=Antrihabitans sp. YC2-6 TaxID=2799498 RepID=UPI0018F727AC|nr:alpha/beta fold hydrolase [Antrihabitans sp. YC2-6]MBJ8343063.1 alpha/beta fold hydrolase [Antrihabitans sp. YC2-6]